MLARSRSDSRAAPATARRARIASAAGLALYVVFAIGLNLFIVSAGTWTHWPFQSGYYDTQAEGYRSGHIHVAKPPKPGLATLADPYNPANMRYWSWDYSYYKGHLHLYWGFLPSALLALAKALFGIKTVVGDEVPAFLASAGRALAGGLLI